MSERFPFRYAVRESVHWAECAWDLAKPLHVSWPGLDEDDPALGDATSPWQRFAVNNNNREEVAAYCGVLWTLCRRRAVFAQPIYYTHDAAAQCGGGPVPVRWEFRVDAEAPVGTGRMAAFQPARSSVQLRPPPPPEHVALLDRGLLFAIDSAEQLSCLLRATLGDAVGSVNVYGLATRERGAALQAALDGEHRPDLISLLREGEFLADLTLGVDQGYQDSLTFASPDELRSELEAAVALLEHRLASYEAAVPTFVSVKACVAALERLRDGED